MKKIFILLISLVTLIGITISSVQSDGWDTATISGDAVATAIRDTVIAVLSDSAYIDSTTIVGYDDLRLLLTAVDDSANNHHIKADVDSVFTDYIGMTFAVHWDLYNNLVADSSSAINDSITVYERFKFALAGNDTALHYRLDNVGVSGEDTLRLAQTGFAITANPDSIGLRASCSNADSVDFEILVVNAVGDTVFYEDDLSLTTTMVEYKFAASGIMEFEINDRYAIVYTLRMKNSEWMKIGKAEVW